MTDNNNKDPFLQVDLYRAAQDNRLLRPYDVQFAGVPGTPAEMLPPTMTKQERLDEEQIQRAVEEGRTVIKSFGDGKFGAVTDSGTEWDRGYLAMQSGELPKMMSTGFGERNLENVRLIDSVINDKVVPNMTTTSEAYSWRSQASTVGEYFWDVPQYFTPTAGVEMDEENKKKIAVVDPEFNLERRVAEVNNLKKTNPGAYEYMRRTGVDPVSVTSAATNIHAFKYMLWESMQQAVYNRNIEHFNSSAWAPFARGANMFTHSPTVMRDTIALTALTLGYGTTLRLLGSSVEAAAVGAEATAAARAASVAAKAVAAAQKVTGPMTGLLEGPAFLAMRGAGMSGTRILAARTVAIALDASVTAGLTTLNEQHRQYEWKNLLYKIPDAKFEYDFKEAAVNMGYATMISLGMLGFMRFAVGGVLGDVGNVSHGIKTGDWSRLGRSVANSLDGWATTKNGMIVYGNKLSEGRGVLFGNLLDESMKKIDGRSSASIMMGGSRLFGKVDPHIAAKMNLDLTQAAGAIDKFEKITGIAGEAAMRGVADADPTTARMFATVMDKNFLADNGLTHASVERLFTDYEMAMNKTGGVFPSVKDAAGNILEHAPSSSDKIGALLRLVEAHIIDRNIKEYGISSADILGELETLVGSKPVLSLNADFKSFQEIAIHRVGDKAEQSMLDILSPMLARSSDPEAEVTVMGRTIPLSVANNLGLRALETEASKTYSKSWRYITNAGTDTDSASFVLKYDPDTGVVEKTGRSLEYDATTGRVKRKFDVHGDSMYIPERIVSVKEMGEKFKAMQTEIDGVWKDTMKTKVKKLVDEGKVDPVAVKTLDDLFKEGKPITAENLKSIFRLKTKAQAVTANIITKLLGYSDGEDVLRIAKAQKGSINDKATANIVFDATKALIQSTRQSDMGSITHEMGHYNRLMFMNEDGLRDREAIGISEGMWKNFLKWVGNEDDIWTNDARFIELEEKAKAGDVDAAAKVKTIIDAEEKYTNGFTYYIKSVMKGEGKAPDSVIQRLMHKLGDHLGNIGERFKTQEALEAGLGMTDEAAEVYSKLLDRSKDKIGDYFDSAYRGVFSRLPAEQRNAIGTQILGDAMWKDYVAKIQKNTAKSKAITDGVVEKYAVKHISKQKLIESIHAELSGGVTKKLIRDAVDAGSTIDDIKKALASYVEVEEKLFHPTSQLVLKGGEKPNAVQRNRIVSMLRADEDLMKRFAEKTANDETLNLTVGYKVAVEDGKFIDQVETVGLDKTMREKLVKQAKEAPAPKKPKISKADMEAGTAAVLAALETPSRIVDERGIPMDLSATETAVVTDTAIKHAEGMRNIAKAEETVAKVEETVDLDALLEISREPAIAEPIPVPEKIVVKESEPGTLVAEPAPTIIKAKDYPYTEQPKLVEVYVLEEQLSPLPLPDLQVKPVEGPGMLTTQMATTAEAQMAKATKLGELDVEDPAMKQMIEAVRQERTAEERFKAMGETDSADPELQALIEQVRQERTTVPAEPSKAETSPEGGKPTEAVSEAPAAPESILKPDATPEVVAKVEKAVEAVAEVVPTIARRKAKPSAPPTEVEVQVAVIKAEVEAETGIPSAPTPKESPKAEIVQVLEDPKVTTAEKVEALKKVEAKLETSPAPEAKASKEVVAEVRKELETKKVQEITDNQKIQMQAALEITDAFWRSFKEGLVTQAELVEIKAQLKQVTNDYKKDAFFRWVTNHKNKEVQKLFYADAALRRRWSMDPTADAGRMAQILNSMLGLEAKERSLKYEPVQPREKAVSKTELARIHPMQTYGESLAFKIRYRVAIVEDNFLRSMQSANNTLEDLPPNAKAVLKKIVAKVRKSGSIEDLAEMWSYYLKSEGIDIPKPSHAYIEAELKFLISSEQFQGLKGLTDAELKAFVYVYDEVQANLDHPVMETAIRNPTPENFNSVQNHLGIPAKYMEIYVEATRHIDAAPEVADFQRAWAYVSDHNAEQAELVAFLKDNEAAYKLAVETKSDKKLRNMYERKLGERATFTNAQDRVNKGIVPPKELVDLDSQRAVEVGLMWSIEDEGSYSRLMQIYMKAANSDKGVNVNINDVLSELTHNTNLKERIAKELGVDGDADEIVKAFVAGEDEYNGAAFHPESINAARKYLRRVIHRMTLDNDTAGKGTKKNVRNILATDREGENIEIQVGHNFRLDTDHASDVSRINESMFVKQTAGFLYDRLVAEGKTDLADYFAARRATAAFAGRREMNLETAYARRAKERTGNPVEVTAKFIDTMEDRLSKEMTRLANELIDMGVSGGAASIIRDGRLNLVDPTKMVDIHEAIKLKELDAEAPTEAPVAPKKEFFAKDTAPTRKKAKTTIDPDIVQELNQATLDLKSGDKVDLRKVMDDFQNRADPEMKPIMYDIIFGNIKTADQLLNSVLSQFDHIDDINMKLLRHFRNMEGSKEILKNYAVAYVEAENFIAYVNQHSQVVAFRMSTTLDVVVHELVHVFTIHSINNAHRMANLDYPTKGGHKAMRRFIQKTFADIPNNKHLRGPKFAILQNLMETYLKVSDYLLSFDVTAKEFKTHPDLYGMTDMHEFLAEAVSNPNFREILRNSNVSIPDVLKSMMNSYDSLLSGVKDPTARAVMAASLTMMDTVSTTHKRNIKKWGNNFNYRHVLSDDPRFTMDNSNPIRLDLQGKVTTINDLISLGKNPLRVGHIKNPKVVAELKARADLAAANGRVAKTLNQLREVALSEDTIASAKAAGATSVKELEDSLKKLVETAEIRRRALLDMGYEAEVEPHDIEAIRSAMDGHPELIPSGRGALMRSVGPRNAAARRTMMAKALTGKSYRSLTDDERRSFVTDVLMPKIDEAIGNRNASAGVFSGVSETKVGKWANGLIGGGANYGDTAESGSKGLQFLSKILDPTMDLRDGELNGAFNLFSMDLINAEKNNAYSKSGLLGLKNKIRATVKNPDAIDKFNETAWLYLGRIQDLPKETPHRDLMVEFIQAVHKHNKQMGETLVEYGNLGKEMVPEEYGTIHKVNELAWQDKTGFADALHSYFLKKIKDSDEINLITAEALGWVALKRESGNTDDILSFTIPKESPLAAIAKPEEVHEWNAANRKLFGSGSASKKLSAENLSKYRAALDSTDGYVESWKNLYSSRGSGYTAIRRSMEIARDRYLGLDLGDSKTGKPRSEVPSNMRDRSETRILSHNDITSSPELAKYFHKEIYDLVYQQLNHDYTDALMTKHITKFFGTKMSWLDLVHVLGSYGEETMDKANMSLAEITSRRDGYKRMTDIWEAHIGKMQEGRDGVDKYYKAVMENSKIGVLMAGGIKAAISSVGEVNRALLSSNQHRKPVIQLVDNLKKAIHLAISRGKRDSIKEVASATHWIRGLSADHLLARSDINPSNPFNGLAMGTRTPGFFQRLVQDWRQVGKINKAETNALSRGMNYLGIAAQRLGVPLAYVNDISTCIHIWNAQENFTRNSGTFLKLAEDIQGRKFSSLKEMESLAAKCGIRPQEALNLSTANLLDPEAIKIISEAAKDQSLYSDGLLDVQKMYRWADGDKVKIDAIDKMGGYINMTARQTNAEPTLLDLRVNQSLYAKSMSIFTQFLLTHSVQEIGRRRRMSTTNYGVHLVGLMLMEMLTYAMIRNRDERGVVQQVEEEPIKLALMNAASMPMYGSYSLWMPVLRAMMTNAYNKATDEKMGERIKFPDLYGAPSETAHIRAYETMAEMFGK